MNTYQIFENVVDKIASIEFGYLNKLRGCDVVSSFGILKCKSIIDKGHWIESSCSVDEYGRVIGVVKERYNNYKDAGNNFVGSWILEDGNLVFRDNQARDYNFKI